MSLQRLSISLHCWPARRAARRAPTALPDAGTKACPDRRFSLAEVALEGDDVRDIERFDSMVTDALVEAAERLQRIAGDRLGTLRDLGYMTRVEISAIAGGGPYEVQLPLAFIDACHRVGVSVQVSSDPTPRDGSETIESFADASSEE